MRGTPDPRRSAPCGRGIIPAYAGNTSTTRARRCRPRDHPRVCGEHAREHASCELHSGSSPRMRGTLGGPAGESRPSGIIPAYAGNTKRRVAIRAWSWDHPRVCGEHMYFAMVCAPSWGSSPRMRGTLRGGKFRRGLSKDHPRVCGEHRSVKFFRPRSLGSSPRMRGTQRLIMDVHGAGGIIPAYAGNTGVRHTPHMPLRDHPRVCGEHASTPSPSTPRPGSSPRMRGTHHRDRGRPHHPGIIPAYAGNT